MKVVALVPMKLNNRRLPNKNTKPFTNGKPLCHYILSTLLKVKEIDEIYVYCSNPEIKEFIPDGVKYLQRSESLDQDSTKINEVLSAFANDVPADVYVLSHATAPFISADSIKKGIDGILYDGYDSAFSARKLQEFIWKDGQPFNYELDNIPRTQDLELLYMETCGLYVYRRELILNEGRRIGNNPYLLPVSKIEACDINTMEDFQIADAIYHYQKIRKELS